jgi:hypothetical protein
MSFPHEGWLIELDDLSSHEETYEASASVFTHVDRELGLWAAILEHMIVSSRWLYKVIRQGAQLV